MHKQKIDKICSGLDLFYVKIDITLQHNKFNVISYNLLVVNLNIRIDIEVIFGNTKIHFWVPFSCLKSLPKCKIQVFSLKQLKILKKMSTGFPFN